MVAFDIFNNNAFSTTSLMAAIEKVPFQPQFLGSLGLFEDMGVLTEGVWIEERSGVLNLIQTSPRGAPLAQRTTEKRAARGFMTPRLAKADTIRASEIQGIRAMGSENELMEAQAEVARRLSGPTGLMAELEMTNEYHRLGAIQGILLDADGSTLYNFFTEFGVSQPTEIAFDLTGANAAGTTVGAPEKLRPFIQQQVVRPMTRAAQGLLTTASRIIGLCGDSFYDDIRSHGDVRQTYLNQQAAASLRDGTAFDQFDYGGVTWVNYRGTDDNSTVAIGVDKVKFFFRNAPGLFKRALSPGEFFDVVNQKGRPVYPKIIPDNERQIKVDIEVYSYPLHICTRPATLYSGKRGS